MVLTSSIVVITITVLSLCFHCAAFREKPLLALDWVSWLGCHGGFMLDAALLFPDQCFDLREWLFLPSPRSFPAPVVDSAVQIARGTSDSQLLTEPATSGAQSAVGRGRTHCVSTCEAAIAAEQAPCFGRARGVHSVSYRYHAVIIAVS